MMNDIGKNSTKKICCALAVVLLMSLNAAIGAAGQVTVFAAASTTNALSDIGRLFGEKKMGDVVFSFASPSTLAKQIENGAPANLFVSADLAWMDYLEKKEMVEPGTRINLLGNRLVLIAPTDNKVNVNITPALDISKLLSGGRLSTGDPSHVPVGKYAQQALTKLGLWEKVKEHVAGARDVRSALMLVERGEAPLGIVYATDAAISKKVRIIGVFPKDSHPQIVYPVALVKGNVTPVAKDFLEFLRGPEAGALFEKYGFSVRR
jgi:molybdate transport system substrate-binding protein